MKNFLDDAPPGYIDYENDDTIEMELSQSALQMLRHAAAPTDLARPSTNQASPSEDQPCPSAEQAVKGGEALPSGVELAPLGVQSPLPGVEQVPRAGDQALRGGQHAPEDRRPAMSTLRFALILAGVAAASALLTSLAYRTTTLVRQPDRVATSSISVPPAPVPPTPVQAPPITVAQPPPPPPSAQPSPSIEPEPTRFVNPFDHKEVFEFAPGTSRADARDAVAELLSERARDRHAQLVRTPSRAIANGSPPRS